VDQIDDLFWNKQGVNESVVANVDAILQEYFDPFVTKMLDARGLQDNWFLVVSGLGERLSVPIVAAAMTSLTKLTAKEIYTEKLIIADTAARNKSGVEMDMTRNRVRRALVPLLNDGIVPVVSGFIAGTVSGDVVTLGRGGSDLTSTLLADAIDASEVHLWKVESSSLESGFMKEWKELPDQLKWTGIRTVCPNTVKDSKVVGTMSYEEAAELTHFGKKVLHMATMEPIAEKQIPLFVRNTAIPEHPGTQICVTDKRGVVSAVAAISYPNYKKLHGNKAHLAKLFAQVDDLSKGGDYSIVSLIGLHLDKSPQKKMEAILARYAPLSLPCGLLDSVGSSSSVSMVVKNDVVGEAQEALHAAFVQPSAFL
jgi:aspartate kinase